MTYYLIVHPQSSDFHALANGSTPKYQNQWVDENLLSSIETTSRVVAECQTILLGIDRDQWVYIYRTAGVVGNRHRHQKICCRARLDRVDEEKNSIHFKDQERLDLDPPFTAGRGMNSHEGAAPAA
jgi:hypothetical protein